MGGSFLTRRLPLSGIFRHCLIVLPARIVPFHGARLPISKNGVPILSLADWETHGGLAHDARWVDGRSAREAARAWLEGGGVDLPKEVATILKRHEAFGRVAAWSAALQAGASTDDATVEPRDSDLLVDAEDANGRYLIAVHAQGDEPFGDTVGDTLAAAVERLVDGDRSAGTDGVTRLLTALLGPRSEGDPPVKDIRHGLLTACAACLSEAERRGNSRALLLIHEFVTGRTVDKKLLLNTIDLGRFVKRLSHGTATAVNAGDIRGPFVVPGAPLLSTTIGFFIGKVSRNTRTRPG